MADDPLQYGVDVPSDSNTDAEPNLRGAQTDSECATIQQLEAYARGASNATISRHLTNCEACQAALSDVIDNHSLASMLRSIDGLPDSLAVRLQPASPSVDVSPDLVPGYRILEEISRGGQGVIYRAIQLGTFREVAIKTLLHGVFASECQRRRFELEAEIVARLHHPGIVEVHEIVRLPRNRYAICMQFVRGISLEEHIAGLGKGRVRAILELFLEVCAAVAHAHRSGVIHRDLKPSNILIDAQGHPHVVDFGLAKRVGGTQPRMTDVQITMTGDFAGSFEYAAPEQLNDPRAADIRSDVYSLAVTLYKMISGVFPVETTNLGVADALLRLQSVPASPLSTRMPDGPKDLNPDLDIVLAKALEKDPERRYATVEQFAGDVRAILDGFEVSARPPSISYKLRKLIWRHRVAATVALAFALTLLLSTVGLSVLSLKLKARREALEGALIHSQVLQARSMIGSGDRAAAELQLFRRLAAAWGARPLTGKVFESDDPHAIRAFWALVEVMGHQPCLASARLPQSDHDTPASNRHIWQFPDRNGVLLYSAGNDYAEVISLPDLKPLRTVPWNCPPEAFHFYFKSGSSHVIARRRLSSDMWAGEIAPDGSIPLWRRVLLDDSPWPVDGNETQNRVPIAVVDTIQRDYTLKGYVVYNDMRMSQLSPPDGTDTFGSYPAWLPGQQECRIISNDKQDIITFDLRNGSIVERLALPDADIVRNQLLIPQISTDRTGTAVFVGFAKSWYTKSLTHQSSWHRSPDIEQETQALFPSDRGDQVISMSTERSRSVWLWNTDPPALVREIRGHTNRLSIGTWVLDDRAVATVDSTGLVRLWDSSCDGVAQPLPLQNQQLIVDVHDVQWTSDDSLLIAANGGLDQISLVPGWVSDASGTLQAPGQFSALSFSPDRRLCVAVNHSGQAWTALHRSGSDHWTATDFTAVHGNRDLGSPQKIAELISAVDISPDARRVAFAGRNPALSLWYVNADGTLRHDKTLMDDTATRSSLALFSPDGRWVLSRHNEALIVWDVESGRQVAQLTGHKGYVRSASYSSDGKSLFSVGDDRRPVEWSCEGSPADWKLRKRFETGPSELLSMELFANDKLLACGGRDGTLSIWSTLTREHVATIRIATTPVLSVTISPSESTLALGIGTGGVRIIDLANLVSMVEKSRCIADLPSARQGGEIQEPEAFAFPFILDE